MPAPAVRLRRALHGLRQTPFHPQWLVLRDQPAMLRCAAEHLGGTVLDIGCAARELQAHLRPGTRYLGLDYPATVEDYGTCPDVFGDAHRLPLADASVDGVALLDVLEHLADPSRCLAEIARVLKPGGRLVLQIPFLYPLHDEPRDFQRYTGHGLRRLLPQHGLSIDHLEATGRPAEAAAALWNIALAKRLLEYAGQAPLGWLALVALLPVAAVALPLVNLAGWLLARGSTDTFMPLGYRVVCTCRPRSS